MAELGLHEEKTSKAQPQVIDNDDAQWNHRSFDDLPGWLQGNGLLRGSHRPQLSWSTAFSSLFRLHTEFFNIWSHLIAGLMFVVIEISSICASEPIQKSWPFHIYRIGTISCFLASATFHLFQCVSPTVYSRLAALDYVGITISMATGGIATVQIAEGLSEVRRQEYTWALVAVAVGVIWFIVSSDGLHLPPKRLIRSSIFLLYASCLCIPAWEIFHSGKCSQCFGQRASIMAFNFALGLVLYTVRIPERFFQNWWIDNVFQSHLLFHVAVAIGSTIFYSVLLCLAKK